MSRQILSNALLVLPGATTAGSVVIEGQRIADIIPERNYPEGVDLRGSLLIPGVIDIHTDYIEKEIEPRPEAQFPLELALHYMDLRAISCGVTTVLSAARVSSERDGMLGAWSGDGLKLAREYESFLDRTKARHLIHVRWDTNFEPAEEALEQIARLKSVGNLVYNENIPGERQFRDVEGLIRRQANRLGISIEESRTLMDQRIANARSINNRAKVKEALAGVIPIGSHDDTTVEHVLEAHEAGASLAEMPVTLEAARKAKELGMMVCMGAPNYYRGGSHCGNLSCVEAMAEGLVDILCSDYHFPSLLGSAVLMMRAGMNPSAAINLMSLHPARHLGLADETGSIETGKRADLAAIQPHESFASVSHVWVNGRLNFQAERMSAAVAPSYDSSNMAIAGK